MLLNSLKFTPIAITLSIACFAPTSAALAAVETQSIASLAGKDDNDFRDETIYFLLPARFYDGDSANNFYCRDNMDIEDPHWRGDFKGLISKLDYIKDLGFTAIWITPPIENRSGLDYHGYHGYDWFQIDPRLESEGATFQDFILAAHRKGLKVVLDLVINHSSNYGIRSQVWVDRLPIKYFRSHETFRWPYVGNLGNYKFPFREDNDNPLAPLWFRERAMRDPEGIEPLRDPVTGVTLPLRGYRPDRFFHTDVQRLSQEWFHPHGYIQGGDWENPWALQQKHICGDCLDLATERPNVQNYLNAAVKRFIDMGIDAIRLDTAKHLDRDELIEKYVRVWKSYKPDLFVFGEVLVKGTGWGNLDSSDNGPSQIRPWWYTRLGQDPFHPRSGGYSGLSVLDFSLFSTFRDNVTRGHFGGLGGVFGMDWVYGDATQLVTFFQNHDLGPDHDFKFRFGGDPNFARMAYNLMFTARGIPSIYYGEEIQFQGGKPQDIDSGRTLIRDTGRAYFGDHLNATQISQTRQHPLARHIRELNRIRSESLAIRRGHMERVNEWGSGMSFVRRYGNDLAVVGLAAQGGQNIRVDGLPHGTYRNLRTGQERSVSGTLDFHVPAYDLGAWVKL